MARARPPVSAPPRRRLAVAAAVLGGLAAAACGGGSTGPGATAAVEIVSGPTEVRQGDVVTYAARTGDAAAGPIAWSLVPTSGGLITDEGRFVGYDPGTVRVVARAGGSADTVEVRIEARGVEPGSFVVVGHGEVRDRFTSDLWLHGEVAYTGTWSTRVVGGTARPGDVLYAWDVSDPAAPRLTDSVRVDARRVNDVKIRADGMLAVLTHEGSTDGRNGITLLDLSDPRHPVPVVRYTDGLEFGVHNTWFEGDHVYAAANGTDPDRGSGLHVVDVSDPTAPREVATFWGGGVGLTNFLHDVYVRDELAFLSQWDAGLIILDVGNGAAGGSPSHPVELGRVRTGGGNVHNAWYWPATDYAFVGEEDFSTPGEMHVVDASELAAPREVATYRVPGDTPHNFWLDEEREILFLAWYTQGLRALDVSGELLGELHRQGREIASIRYDGTGFCSNDAGGGTCTWAPHLHEGHVFVSDVNSGIWALRFER